MAARLTLAACLTFIAGAVCANAPVSSLHPMAKPAQKLEAPLPPALGSAVLRPKPRPTQVALAQTAPLASGLTASLRPVPRPAAVVRVPVTILRPSLDLPRLAEVAPPMRPENLIRLTTVSAVTSRMPDQRRDKDAGVGGVCGDPDLKGEMLQTISASVKGCGLEEGVKITSVAGVRLSPAATVDCTTAEALKIWVDGTVKPAVGRLGGGVAKLQIAGSYDCRPRNNQRGNQISEHGKGRAVDIAAVVLDNGTVISVLKDWGRGKHGKFLKKIRQGACGTFMTVLGPGSDRFHRDHLHLDTAHGRGPYCK